MNSNDDNVENAQLKQFILNEQIKLQIQQQIIKLNKICFEQCVEKPGAKLDSKQETCITNCVGRYIDTNEHVANLFARRANVPSDSFS